MKNLMKCWMAGVAMMMIGVLCGCTTVEEKPEEIAKPVVPMPTSLDLPADFKVTEEDWLDNERARAGWFLNIRMLRGKAITARNGVEPIHVMKANIPQFEGKPLQKDDLIIGVNGKPLVKDSVNLFVAEVKRTMRGDYTLDVTRWRKGEIATVTLDLPRPEDDVPDLTDGGEPNETRDWTLGPIGVNGWGYAKPAGQGGTSKLARQLLITLVDETGPAAEKLKKGDVIVGVDGKAFTWDARRALAEAINEAEKVKNEGKLNLLVWREGTEMDVEIQLQVLGTYSKTAPYDCPKTEKIIDNAVAYMLANKESLLKPSKTGGWISFINALGLLSTGRDDVMPALKEFTYASLMDPGYEIDIVEHRSMQCWWWSYRTVFLCEYYLKTGDKAVLPTIEEYATKIAMGQSGAGTWGHTYAAINNTGKMHGHLGGYGAINQQGLTLMIALPLAVKCGINNQEITAAIKRGDDFFSFFIGKGTIPYGDHGAANQWFDDNGKSGAAAIFFDLMDNKAGTEFFSEMVLASTPSGREAGHTGHYWSHLWGGVGAARGGDKGLQVFMDVMNPIFTMERQHNGRFAFQDNAGHKGHQGKPKAKWDCTGARLLQLCYPRRELYVTGKETSKKTHLTDSRIKEVLHAGKLDIDSEARAKLTKDEIFELLSDPLPTTRTIAVKAMEERELNAVDDLMKMLDSKDRYARYGAAQALGRVGYANKEAAEKLIGLIQTEKDTLFRVYAVDALCSSDTRLGLLRVAKPAIPVLLKIATEQIDDDPRRVLQHDITRTLFYNGRAQPRRGLIPYHGIDDEDRPLLIPAIKSILTNANGSARSGVAGFMYPQLTPEELSQLWGDIYVATRYIAPSGIMFAPGARTHGLEVMSEHKVKEGMYLAAWYVRWQKGHGGAGRVPNALKALEGYGANAQEVLPYLESHLEYWKQRPETAKQIQETIAKIKASTEKPELISIADQIDPSDIPPKDGP